MLDASAQQFADKTALIFPDTSLVLSYSELLQRVQLAAGKLAAMGLSKGSKVAISLPNGPEFVDFFLGSLYGGFVVVPLDYQSSHDALRYTLQHCEAQLFISTTDISGTAITQVRPDFRPDTPFSRDLPEIDTEDFALIDYTSGTTDNPKGVLLGHSQLVANTEIHTEMYDLSESDTTMLVMPLHHLNPQSVSLLSTLYTGGTVVIPDSFRIRNLVRHIHDFGCTWAALVPAMLEQMLSLTQTSQMKERDLCPLRFIRCSSAPLSAITQKKFEDQFSVPVLQAMGSTEVGSTFFSNPLPPKKNKHGSVGLPTGFYARVVDESGKVLSDREIGSIQIFGDTLMLSYYRNEKATNEVFNSSGWLVTGDVGFRDEDGYYFIVGRRTEIVNKGGEKIPLSEVDAVLLEHPRVKEAAAVAISDDVYGQELAAFVVLAADVSLDELELLKHCNERLGTMRTPTRIFSIENLPRTSTLKIKRSELARRAEEELEKQLIQLRLSRPETDENTVSIPPSNLTERIIADMFSSVLQLDKTQLVRDDDFFSLGGNSLDATRFRRMINIRNLGDLPVRQLFEQPTIKGIAHYIESARDSLPRDRSSIVSLRSEGNQPPLFFVPGGGGGDNVIFFLYGKIVEYIKKSTPVHAFRAHGVEGQEQVLHNSIEKISADYIRDMKQKQPDGPYHLVGFCIGGLIAYEMAQQLIQQGDRLSLLVLVDTRHPGTRGKITANSQKVKKFKKALKRLDRFYRFKLWQRLSLHLQTMKQMAWRDKLSYFFSKLKLVKLFYLHATRPYTSSHSDIEKARNIFAAKKHYQDVAQEYNPVPYPGDLTLIVSDNVVQRELPWQNLNPGRVTCDHVSGDHDTHIREHADEVAAALNSRL